MCFVTLTALATAKYAKAEDKSQPTSRPAQTGAVQNALKKLYVMPRSSINNTGPKNISHKKEPSKKLNSSTKSKPRKKQKRDQTRNSVSRPPIGNDINAPVNKDLSTQVHHPDDPPLFFMTPYPYYHDRRHGLSHRQRRWSNYRYFGGRPGRYGYGRHDYWGGQYEGDVYRYGFMRGYNVGRFDQTGYQMQEAALQRHQIYLERALTLFKQGQYHEAASTFKLAADSNQSDPAARIYAAHALFAIGRYRDAAEYLRLAFKLQPKIAKLYYDMRDDYGDPIEFDKQLAALDKAIQLAPRDIHRLTVKGYILYYTHQRHQAYEVLAKAKKIDPENNVINQLLDNCQPPDVIVDQMKNKKQKP
jgi:hypothetical protein